MSASSQKETCAFAFETSLLVGQAQQTLVSKRHASWLAIIAVLTAIAGYLQHELQEHPGVAKGIWLFHQHWRGPDCLRDIILAIPAGRMIVSLSSSIR
jgi:hypothetical protein